MNKALKYLIHLSIFLILVLPVFSFSPLLSHAEDEPRGMCRNIAGGSGAASGYTKKQCDDAGGVWTADNPAPATGNTRLVPCDNSSGNKCDFVQFMKLINNVLDFIFKFLVVPIAAVMFAYAGFLLVTAGGGEAKTKAKGIFTDAFIGLILAAAAWLIVKALLSILGFNGAWIGFPL